MITEPPHNPNCGKYDLSHLPEAVELKVGCSIILREKSYSASIAGQNMGDGQWQPFADWNHTGPSLAIAESTMRFLLSVYRAGMRHQQHITRKALGL